jgi:curved DNA-binding protein CbpA
VTDPYQVLGLSRHATEDEIRKRYLELVREFSPDRAPERFAEIRAAYDAVRDPSRRIAAQLFDPETTDTLDALATSVRKRLRERSGTIPVDVLLALAES